MDYPRLTGFIIFMVLLAVAVGIVSYFVIKKFPKTYWIFNHVLILYPYYYMLVIAVPLILVMSASYAASDDTSAGYGG